MNKIEKRILRHGRTEIKGRNDRSSGITWVYTFAANKKREHFIAFPPPRTLFLYTLIVGGNTLFSDNYIEPLIPGFRLS